MKIKVTEHDIKYGKPLSLYSCPVAKAIRREFQYPFIVEVSKSAILMIEQCSPTHRTRRWPTPPEVAAFIVNFDSGQNVEPFEFELEGESP